jgi:hypothetical protein
MFYHFFNHTTCEEYRVPVTPGSTPCSAEFLLRFLGHLAVTDQFKYLGLVG